MIALLLTLLAPTAHATEEEDNERASELFVLGKERRDAGEFAEAIDLWWQSYELVPEKGAIILSYIAVTEERRGNSEEALGIWRRFLPMAKGDSRAEAEAAIARLERSIPPEPAPRPVPVPVTPAPEPVVQPPPPEEVVRTSGGTKGLGFALIGVGVVSGGAGIASGLVSRAAADRVAENCKGPGDMSGLCTVDASGDYRTHRTTAALADVGFVVGAAAIVTGTLLVVTSKGKRTSVGVGLDGIRIRGAL